MSAAAILHGEVARNVLITSGKFGVAFKNDSQHTWYPAYTLPKERFKSSVGAGDSFVAGFTMSLDVDPEEFGRAVRFGMACAAAQCETFEPGNLLKSRALEIFESGKV
jgi:fructose-1-phosphate kinase PfkB-like protein